MAISPECNFIFLAENYQYLAHSACIAESCLYSDPHNCIIKMGILNEEICRIICDKCKIEINKKDKFANIVHRLKKIFFTEEDATTYMKIEDIAKSRNIAAHNIPKDEKALVKYTKIAAETLLAGYALSTFFYVRFIDADYEIQEFHMPKSQSKEDDYISCSIDIGHFGIGALSYDTTPSLIFKFFSKIKARSAANTISKSVKSSPRGSISFLPDIGHIAEVGLQLAGAYAAAKDADKAVKILPPSLNMFFDDLEIDSESDSR